jgi:HEAT repeat protein
VRYAAAWALGKIGTPEALEILRRAKRDRAAMVRNYVHEKLLGEEKLLADELLTADEEPGAGVAEDVVEKERDGIQAGS